MQRVLARAGTSAGVAFGHVVLAAPDVNERTFRDLAAASAKLAGRTTLYASSKDRALASSGILHDHPRAGYTPPVTVVPPVETIEVSNVQPNLSRPRLLRRRPRPAARPPRPTESTTGPPELRMGLVPVQTEAGDRYWMIGA